VAPILDNSTEHRAPSVTIRRNVSNILKLYSWRSVFVSVGEVTLWSTGGREMRMDFLGNKCRCTILSTHSTIWRCSVVSISKLFIAGVRSNIPRDSQNIISVVSCIFLWIEQKFVYELFENLCVYNGNVLNSSFFFIFAPCNLAVADPVCPINIILSTSG